MLEPREGVMRMLFRLSVLFALGGWMLWLSACGGRPSYEDVGIHIDNPTGTVNAQTTGKAWRSYAAGNSGATSQAGGSYVTLPQSLTLGKNGALTLRAYLERAGVPTKLLPQVTAYLPFTNKLEYRPVQFVQPAGGALTPKGFPIGIPGCLSVSGSNNQGQISLNLGCVGKDGESGWLTIRFRGWQDNKGTAAQGEVELIFDNVCDGKGSCLHGELGVRAEATDNGAFKGNMTMAYYMKVTTPELSMEGKGGLRAFLDEKNKRAKLEVVTFYKGPEKEESLVMVFSAQGEQAAFSIKGSNGTFSCSTSDAGVSGSCQAENKQGEQFNWSRNASE